MTETELISSIIEWVPSLDGTIGADTPLISSGRLDSVGLFRLVLCIEEAIGDPVDATAVDIRNEWDTVRKIMSYVEDRRSHS